MADQQMFGLAALSYTHVHRLEQLHVDGDRVIIMSTSE